MGQVLSNIVQFAYHNLLRLGHNLLLPPPSPTSTNESNTSSCTALLPAPPLSSSRSSNSCSDLTKSGSSLLHLSSRDLDLRGDSTTSTALQRIALGRQQCLNSNIAYSSTTSALHQNSHGDLDLACVLQQEILVSSESLDLESLREFLALELTKVYSSTDILSNSSTYVPTILDPPLGVDLNIEVVGKKRQAIPSLSHVNSLEPSGKERERERERERKEEKVSKGVVIKERWIKHYSSHQKILLVGDGDFSFSACLAVAFGSANNMIATSLNSQGFLRKNYSKASSNVEKLRSRGCKVTHGVDATEMAKHLLFEGMEFDRIIFNFPHAGFLNHESRKSQLRRHRKLVRKFLANAKKMITENGEIHISHKSNSFFLEWNVEFLASQAGLRVIEAVDFNLNDYPGYHTKYGFGGDKNFNCNPSKTYKFGLRKKIKNTLYYY